jgi:hypothetical protein
MSTTVPIPDDSEDYDSQDLIEADEYDSDKDYHVEPYDNTLTEHEHSYHHIKHLRYCILFFKNLCYKNDKTIVNLGSKHKHLGV